MIIIMVEGWRGFSMPLTTNECGIAFEVGLTLLLPPTYVLTLWGVCVNLTSRFSALRWKRSSSCAATGLLPDTLVPAGLPPTLVSASLHSIRFIGGHMRPQPSFRLALGFSQRWTGFEATCLHQWIPQGHNRFED